MLRSCEKSISRQKNRFFPWRNFRLLYYLGILQRLQHLIIQFPLCFLLVVAYGRLKAKENFKLLALKVVAVAYERWSLTRGSQCSDLAEKLLVFWKNWSLMRGGSNRRFDCINIGRQLAGCSGGDVDFLIFFSVNLSLQFIKMDDRYVGTSYFFYCG